MLFPSPSSLSLEPRCACAPVGGARPCARLLSGAHGSAGGRSCAWRPWAAAAGPHPPRKLDAEPASRCRRPLPAGTSQDADRGAVRLPGHQGKLHGCHKCPMAASGASFAPPSPRLASPPPKTHPAFPGPRSRSAAAQGQGHRRQDGRQARRQACCQAGPQARREEGGPLPRQRH